MSMSLDTYILTDIQLKYFEQKNILDFSCFWFSSLNLFEEKKKDMYLLVWRGARDIAFIIFLFLKEIFSLNFVCYCIKCIYSFWSFFCLTHFKINYEHNNLEVYLYFFELYIKTN